MEADLLLVVRDRFVQQTQVGLTSPNVGYRADPISARRKCRLELGNGFCASALYPQEPTFRVMSTRIARRKREDLRDQPFGARDVGIRGIGHLIEQPGDECHRQSALCFDKPWVEIQRSFKRADCLGMIVARFGIGKRRASPKNVVQRVGVGGRPGCLRPDQRGMERDSDAAGDLVLQGKQIAGIALEPLGPQMRAGLGVDQLGVDTNLLGRALTLPSRT